MVTVEKLQKGERVAEKTQSARARNDHCYHKKQKER